MTTTPPPPPAPPPPPGPPPPPPPPGGTPPRPARVGDRVGVATRERAGRGRGAPTQLRGHRHEPRGDARADDRVPGSRYLGDHRDPHVDRLLRRVRLPRR